MEIVIVKHAVHIDSDTHPDQFFSILMSVVLPNGTAMPCFVRVSEGMNFGDINVEVSIGHLNGNFRSWPPQSDDDDNYQDTLWEHFGDNPEMARLFSSMDDSDWFQNLDQAHFGNEMSRTKISGERNNIGVTLEQMSLGDALSTIPEKDSFKETLKELGIWLNDPSAIPSWVRRLPPKNRASIEELSLRKTHLRANEGNGRSARNDTTA